MILEKEIHTVIGYDDWLEWAENRTLVQKYGANSLYDLATARFLKDSFSGFMQSPVAMYKGIPLEAKSRAIVGTIEKLLEAKEYIENLKKNDDVFLYEIVFVPATATYMTVDTDTFAPIKLDPPIMSDAFWRISYATLNNEHVLKAV